MVVVIVAVEDVVVIVVVMIVVVALVMLVICGVTGAPTGVQRPTMPRAALMKPLPLTQIRRGPSSAISA